MKKETLDRLKLPSDSRGDKHKGAPSNSRRRRFLWRSAIGLGAFGLAGTSFVASGSAAFASSSAPTQGKTTCTIAGDECTNAINYANTYDGGGAIVLAVEADTETHGGTVSHRVFDILMQTNNGIYSMHVYRNDSAPYLDSVWWQSLAEKQSPSGTTSGSSSTTGSTSDNSPDTTKSSTTTTTDSSPDHSNDQNQSTTTKPADDNSPDNSKSHNATIYTSDSPKINASQAANDATSFVTAKGYQVLGTKHEKLKSKGQKDYYKVKLQLGLNGKKHGTASVWVDATSSPGTVTAVSGDGLKYRDTTIVSSSTAQANAISANGGSGTVYKTSLHGGKWRWYWVSLRVGSTKYKVGVDAVTGVVTQIRRS